MMDVSAQGQGQGQGQGLPKNLVIFSSSLDPGDFESLYYVLESFQISKLIGSSLKRRRSDVSSSNKFITLEKPKDMFVWRGTTNPLDPRSTRYARMSFLHVGGGKVYAVGGVLPENSSVIASEHESSKSYDTYTCYTPIRNSFFRCISLSTPLQGSTFEYKKSMAEAKYYPLIVEMDGLIYVLSGPPNRCSHHVDEFPFEVYDPLKDEWMPLPPPPFHKVHAGYCILGMTSYSHAVIGKKLLVSTDHFSCTFDTSRLVWEACNVFSECKLKERIPIADTGRYLIEEGLCGPPFPFQEKAIFYRENIILCARPMVGELGVIAFKIIDDGEKALQIPIQFDDFPKSSAMVIHLVDFGDDYFAALTCEFNRKGMSWSDDLVILTFKVVSKMKGKGEGEGEIEALVCEMIQITRRDHSCLFDKENGLWRRPLYCFAM